MSSHPLTEKVCRSPGCHADGQPQPRAAFERESGSRFLSTSCWTCRKRNFKTRGKPPKAVGNGPRFECEADRTRWLEWLRSLANEVTQCQE